METSTVVSRFGSCTLPCTRSTSSFLGCPESNFFAEGRRELNTQVNLALSWKRSPAVYRCLYSPLVESYVEPQSKAAVTRLDSNIGQKILVSPSAMSVVRSEGGQSALERDAGNVETLYTDQNVKREQGRLEGGSIPAAEDPVAASSGDASLLASASDASHDFEARRSARYKQPQTMSLTQGFRATPIQGNIGVAGGPASKTGKIGGPAGLLVGLTVAGLGIATAFQKATEGPQKFCSRCDGYGVECCDVCNGTGNISWEGKAHRKNICPRCFGSCLKKCPRCDGTRAKKESTPVLQQLKTPSKSPPKSSTKTLPKKS